MPKRTLATALTTLSALAALSIVGCRPAKVTKTAKSTPTASARLSDIDLKGYKPNEVGAVMIIMYHRIEKSSTHSELFRAPEEFRKDLETLYKKNYRPVTVSEFIENRMDVPAGKTPVVITFDDSYASQFRVIDKDGKRSIDPDCGVGIIEAMHRDHPDWATKATFYVLAHTAKYPVPFGQPDSVGEKMAFLAKHGYEVGSHTTTHRSMTSMKPDEVMTELATAVRDIHQIAPSIQVTSVATPYGAIPKLPESQKALLKGKQGGTEYTNTSVVLAAWRPVMSPIGRAGKSIAATGQVCAFNPLRIERVIPFAKRAGTPGTLEFYLKFFDANPSYRYVSDGNPNVACVPKVYEKLVDPARVKAQGKTLQVYSFDTPAQSDLSL